MALKQAASSEFVAYAKSVRRNASVLAQTLTSYGYTITSGGTENHLLLWDLRPQRLSGSKMERICELAAITLNKNCVPGDTSAITPGGIRIGTAALTTRGFGESDFEKVAEFLHRAVLIAAEVQEKLPGKKLLKDFDAAIRDVPAVVTLKDEVEAFAARFPMPGYSP